MRKSPKKKNEEGLILAQKRRLIHLISKAYEYSGSPVDEDRIDNEGWCGRLDFSDEQRDAFKRYCFMYIKSDGCMFPLFDLEHVHCFRPNDIKPRDYAAKVLSDAIIKANKVFYSDK